MPNSASSRLGLVGPVGTDAVASGDDIIRAIVTQLEAVGAGCIVDVIANRPTAATANRGYVFIATDAGVSFSTGSAWLDVQPLDSDLTAIAALTTTTIGRSLLAGADAAALRTIIGAVIGTDVQAHDADLDAIAALATTTIGRSLLAGADAAALRTILGLGTAATQASGAFDAAGAASAAQAASQPLDSDLTAIAALATTSFGRSLLTQASAAATLATLGAAPTASPTFTGTTSAADVTASGTVKGQTALLGPNNYPALRISSGSTKIVANYGSSSVTFSGSDTSGLVSVSHSLGVVPSIVLAMAANPANARIVIQEAAAADTGNCYVRGFQSAGTAITATQAFYWLVIATGA